MLAHPFAALAWLSPAAARRDRRLRRVVRAIGADVVREHHRPTLAEAWRRWRTRRMLTDLDARMLRDIGASHAEARAEAAKPFWQA